MSDANGRVGAEAVTSMPPDPGATSDANALRLTHALWELDKSLTKVVADKLVSLELTPNQYGTLNRLASEGEMSAADLARLSGLRPQTIAVSVAELVRLGLIERWPHPVHRRVLLLGLTDQGLAAWKAADDHVAAVDDWLRQVLGAEEFETLKQRADSLVEALRGASGSAGPLWPSRR